MLQALESGAGEGIPLFLAGSSRRPTKDHRACRLMQRVEPATGCASTTYGQGTAKETLHTPGPGRRNKLHPMLQVSRASLAMVSFIVFASHLTQRKTQRGAH